MPSNNQEDTIQLATDFINNTSQPVFLTGKAGTGKTTFLKYIKENAVKNTAIVAPTGVAAMNAGGTTIHSFFQLPFTPFIPNAKKHSHEGNANDSHNLIRQLRLNAEKVEILQQLDLLIIDEISMVRADVLDAIDTVLRHVRSQSAPFGGVQVLYIGDMYQLPPVIKQDEWQLLSSHYTGPFFFCSQVIAIQPPVYIELSKVYRQRDEDFISLLNQVRNNELDRLGYELLQSRYSKNYIPDPQDRVITLTTHNIKADTINSEALSLIKERAWSFTATIEGTFFENSFPADEILHIKVGAQVMFIKNDMEKSKRYYNGKIGIVNKIENDKVWIESFSGEIKQLIELKKEKWLNIKYTLNKKTGWIEEEELGSFTQYPLRLAWAITIHKSQGLTFDKVVIDAGQAFAPGQVYVALSRCRSMEGLFLISKISYNSLQSDPRIVSFAQQHQQAGEKTVLLQNASQQYDKDNFKSLFDFIEADKLILSFKNWLSETNQSKLNLTEWLPELQMQWDKIIKPGRIFWQQLISIPSDSLQEGSHIQLRIIAGTNYFIKELKIMAGIIQRSSALTDNRQLAYDHDNRLQELYDIISRKIYFLEGCLSGYNRENYQKRKKDFIKAKLNIHAYSGNTSRLPGDVQHADLYKLLKAKRDDLCNELKLPVYMVCSSVSIEQMTSSLPVNLESLGKITGFGKIKIKQFGKEFINIIANYCEENSLETNIGVLPVKKINATKNKLKPNTKLLSFELYKTGLSITDIALERKLTVSTIESHLAHYIEEGKIGIESLLDKQKISMIANAKKSSGSGTLNALKQLLPEISYGEIKFFLASEKSPAI